MRESLLFVRSSVFVVKLAIPIIFFMLSCTCATNLEEELRITYEQKTAIDKLRQRVLPYLTESYMKEDLNLLRWLRATNFNIDDAHRRILENIKWRKQNKIATIHEEDFSDLEDEYPYTFTVDKQGQPVFIGYAGEWDVRNAAVTGRAKRVIRYINKALERGARMVREMQYQGKNVTRLNLLIDLDGFNIAQHGLADKVLFINTPPTVAVAVDMVRSNANSETWKAVQILGKDRTVWQRLLFKIMDRDKIPERLGGSLKSVRKDGDL